MTTTIPNQAEFLASLGLATGGKSLVPSSPAPQQMPTVVQKHEPNQVTLAPQGVNPQTMPAEDIVFDPRLLDQYTDLRFSHDGADASREIFKMYKSPHKDTARHSLLQKRITTFITNTRRDRLDPTGHGQVSETVKSTVDQRDTAAILAANEYSAEQVAEAIRIREALMKAGVNLADLISTEA